MRFLPKLNDIIGFTATALQLYAKKKEPGHCINIRVPWWRRRWDSNPRTLADQLISSQSRYDHFDTSPYLSQHQRLRKRGELMGRTSKNIKLRIPEKPHKIKGFRTGSYRVATTISSRSRYDHFDTAPEPKNSIPWAAKDCKGGFNGKKRRLVGLQYILDKHKKGKRDRVSYAKVELPHNNSAKGDHIPHEQEYNTRHGVSAIADEVCREIRR